MKFSEIRHKIKNLGHFKSLREIKEAGLRIVKNTKTGDYWLIEEEFLKPVIKSPRECKSILIKPEDLKYKVLMVHKSKKELKGKKVLDYIKWGEKQGFNKRPTCRSRTEWHILPSLPHSDILFNQFFNERFLFPWNKDHLMVDHAYYYIIYPENPLILTFVMNTIINFLMVEIYGRTGLGEGALQTYAPEMKPLIVIHPAELKNREVQIKLLLFKKLRNYKPKSIFTELGFDPSKPIREQKPNPLPDRKALDDVVFDALGLTKEERKEVYWAVAELVKNRLEKARSV